MDGMLIILIAIYLVLCWIAMGIWRIGDKLDKK